MRGLKGGGSKGRRLVGEVVRKEVGGGLSIALLLNDNSEKKATTIKKNQV